MALMGEAIKLDTQANVQEVASLIQQALSGAEQESEIHNQIQTTLEQKIHTQESAELDAAA